MTSILKKLLAIKDERKYELEIDYVRVRRSYGDVVGQVVGWQYGTRGLYLLVQLENTDVQFWVCQADVKSQWQEAVVITLPVEARVSA
jgi:hypothetical protein